MYLASQKKMRNYLVALLVLFSIHAKSQVLITLLLGDKLNSDRIEFGLEGGINWAKIDGFETSSFARKWNLGFYFNIKTRENWSVYTGVLVKSNLGVKNLTTGDLGTLGIDEITNENGDLVAGNYSNKINTFMVPLLLRRNFKNQTYIAFGPQFGVNYQSWIEFNSDIENFDVIVKHYNTDLINKIDAGFTVATGYRMMRGKGWTIGAKYYRGFVDVYKDISGTKNRSFFVNLCIPIGVGDKDILDKSKGK